MITIEQLLSMILVGMLWGCTNPLLRRGSLSEDKTNPSSNASTSPSLNETLKAFLKVQVWLPYALNQSGSIVFYALLSQSDLSMAVPTCNALALVFSFITSYVLGERFTSKPIQTILGSALILIGVAICVQSSSPTGSSSSIPAVEAKMMASGIAPFNRSKSLSCSTRHQKSMNFPSCRLFQSAIIVAMMCSSTAQAFSCLDSSGTSTSVAISTFSILSSSPCPSSYSSKAKSTRSDSPFLMTAFDDTSLEDDDLDTKNAGTPKLSLEEKMKQWEATEEEMKAATLGGLIPESLRPSSSKGGKMDRERSDAFDVGLYIAFPIMVLSGLFFALFPFIMGSIDVGSVGPPPTI